MSGFMSSVFLPMVYISLHYFHCLFVLHFSNILNVLLLSSVLQCGQPAAPGKCLQCGALVGGHNHQLYAGNTAMTVK